MTSQSKTHGWFETECGRKVYRRLRAPVESKRSDLVSPQLVRSFSSPVKSMADGKYYDSPRDLERSYRAENNPQGKNYECVGDSPLPEFKAPTVDRIGRAKDIKRAIEEVQSGNVPDVLTTDRFKL